jgi:hypothetical protein
MKEWDAVYPRAGDTVDGREVMEGPVPNTDSISASLEDYTVLPGIREVKHWRKGEPYKRAYSVSEEKRTQELAEAIKASGEISPLIIVVDGHKDGPYVLEGGHRFDALHILDADSFPALVVLDNEGLANAADVPESGQKGGEASSAIPVRTESDDGPKMQMSDTPGAVQGAPSKSRRGDCG